MDYVEWCDEIADAFAIYAEGQYERWVNIEVFASRFIGTFDQDPAPTWEDMVGAAYEVVTASGVSLRHGQGQIRYVDLDQLRDRRARWARALMVELDPASLLLLKLLGDLSEDQETHFSTNEVEAEKILQRFHADPRGVAMDSDRAVELLEAMADAGLAYRRHSSGGRVYIVSYLGVARLVRSFVATDREIDRLRASGEGDALDFKRSYTLNSAAQKWEFVKDVCALANAGGPGPRFLLLGVEDAGEFFEPESEVDAAAHRALLDNLTEERLQEIVTTRTIHSPSIRVAARGDHRDGPYVLIEIARYPIHLPYIGFREPNDRLRADAEEAGEVWIRKGSTKARATPAEVEGLRRQAQLANRLQGIG